MVLIGLVIGAITEVCYLDLPWIKNLLINCEVRGAARWKPPAVAPLGSIAAFEPRLCSFPVAPRQWQHGGDIFGLGYFFPMWDSAKGQSASVLSIVSQTCHRCIAFWGSVYRIPLSSFFPFTGVLLASGSEVFLGLILPSPHSSFTDITTQDTSYSLNSCSVSLYRN